MLFDMDGVVTRTAAVHFAAWKKIFDALLLRHAGANGNQSKQNESGQNQKPFTQEDYLEYVDGKPREDGVRSFLESRGIKLPDQSNKKSNDQSNKQSNEQSDKQSNHASNGSDSVDSIAEAKDEEFLRLIHKNGVEPYETTVSLIRMLRDVGIATALVTASKNGAEILKVTKLGPLFDATVTGVDASELNLHGKPEPDVFLEAARRLSVKPARAVVVEDAEAGVAAGHNGHFGLVIGVARQNNTEALKKHGADVVVTDLSEASVPDCKDKHPQGMALSDLDITEANWVVSYDSFIPEEEGRRESLCALGNGKFCTRGAAFESNADEIHHPGTYLAGGYNSIEIEVEGQVFEREEVVNMPNWICLNFSIEDGEWFDLKKVEILEYSQRLNLREGVLYRDIKFRDAMKRETKCSERRFVHMRFSHLAGQEVTIEPQNWSGKLKIRTALDATILNSSDQVDPNTIPQRHLRTLERTASGEVLFLKVMTLRSELVVAEAAKTTFFLNDSKFEGKRSNIVEEDYVAQELTLSIAAGQKLAMQKIVTLYTSRDRGIYEPGFTAKERVNDVGAFDTVLAGHLQAWRNLWRQFDVFVETTEEYSKLIPSLLLHLNTFHTLQTASPHTIDLDTGVPARGWTGEGYQGHIFWDELFVFPFVNLRMPNISAALLKYRYRRLPEARKIALSYGAKGACFPWQSASDGRENTPAYWWMDEKKKWIRDYTYLEIHVNCAVAYNVWQYFQVTKDTSFMYSYGAEILLEVARFFGSYAKFNDKHGRFEILGIIGPDEFHNGYANFKVPGIDNNAYTNIMAVWTLCRALELLKQLPSDHVELLKGRLDISDDELVLWEKISRQMFVPFMKDGVLCQFEGYEQLEEFPTNKDGMLDQDKLRKALNDNDGYLNQYKISKQADVLMLFYVLCPAEIQELLERLDYPYKPDLIARNSEYYIPRTANHSTLSRVAHAWALGRMNRLAAAKLIPFCSKERWHDEEKLSDQIFYEALGSDYFDVAARGTASTGIHMGAMAGTVDLVQRCITGLVTRDDVLWIDPLVPKPLQRISFSLRYRGQSLTFDITHAQTKITAWHSSAEPIKIGFQDKVFTLNAGETQILKS